MLLVDYRPVDPCPLDPVGGRGSTGTVHQMMRFEKLVTKKPEMAHHMTFGTSGLTIWEPVGPRLGWGKFSAAG